MKNTRWTLLAALVLAAPSLAYAQSPSATGSGNSMSSGSSGMSGMSGSSGMSSGGGSAAGDNGAISNGGSLVQSSSSTTTTEGIGPDGFAVSPDDSTTALPGTGGEPVIMSLIGLSMMVGAFAVRRRISA